VDMPQYEIFLTARPSYVLSWTEGLHTRIDLPRGGCGYGGYASVSNIYNSAPVFCLAGQRDCLLELLSQGTDVDMEDLPQILIFLTVRPPSFV
jgi:hypothetical protein